MLLRGRGSKRCPAATIVLGGSVLGDVAASEQNACIVGSISLVRGRHCLTRKERTVDGKKCATRAMMRKELRASAMLTPHPLQLNVEIEMPGKAGGVPTT